MRDHQRLLEVLGAEVGTLRAHDLEQALHDRRHAREVARAVRALEPERGRPRVARGDARTVAAGLGEELLERPGEQHVATRARDQRGVAGEVARVALEVAWVVELQRIDEHADAHACVLGARAAHQLEMALVQRPHGRDEAQAGAGRASLVAPAARALGVVEAQRHRGG